MPSLTKRFVDATRPDPGGRDVTHWDASLKGFGLRVQPKGAKSFILMYRTREGRLRKLTICKVGKLTPDEARSEALIKLGEVERGGDPAGDKSGARKGITVTELCDRYLKDPDVLGRVKTSTLDADKSRIETHVKPLLGRHKVASLTLADIKRLQTDIAGGKTAKREKPKAEGAPKKKRKRGGVARGGRGVAARTVGMFGTILEYARRDLKILKENPAHDVQKFKGGKRHAFMDADKIKAFGQAMREAADEAENPKALAALRGLLLTGCRRNEILALLPRALEVKHRCIRFEDTKEGAQLRAIGTTAAQHLAAQITDEKQEWVFPADRGKGHFVGLPRVFHRVCARASLTGLSIHSLRHSFASMAEAMGYSQLTIAGLLGHSVPGVTAIYTHLPDNALAAAADAVSAKIAAVLDGKEETAEVVDISTKRKRTRRA